MTTQQILKSAHSILLIDWPSKEVPESLVRAGFQVFVKGGPAPEDYSVYELQGDKVVPRRTGHAPDHVDIVYSYRPLTELPGIISIAKAGGARAIWTQSGMSAAGARDPKGCWLPEEELHEATKQIESAGLTHITSPYIVDAVREK